MHFKLEEFWHYFGKFAFFHQNVSCNSKLGKYFVKYYFGSKLYSFSPVLGIRLGDWPDGSWPRWIFDFDAVYVAIVWRRHSRRQKSTTVDEECSRDESETASSVDWLCASGRSCRKDTRSATVDHVRNWKMPKSEDVWLEVGFRFLFSRFINSMWFFWWLTIHH